MEIDLINIDEKLENIFKKVLDIDFKCMKEEAKSFNLLGHELRLNPRDLLYLFFEIEKSFVIYIPQENILNDKFNNFKNISEIVSLQLYK